MDWITYKSNYWNYFEIIEKDFFDTSVYCEIDKINSNAYSVKYLQLLLSICGEIDSIFKTFCKKLDDSLDVDNCGIDDYIRIIKNSYPTFEKEKVNFYGYKYNDLEPWKSIGRNFHPNFWQVYNNVKHHRDSIVNGKENYKQANQKNVIEALCALYVLEEYWAAFNFVDKSVIENQVMPKFKSKLIILKNWNFYAYYVYPHSEYMITELYFKYIEGNKE